MAGELFWKLWYFLGLKDRLTEERTWLSKDASLFIMSVTKAFCGFHRFKVSDKADI